MKSLIAFAALVVACPALAGTASVGGQIVGELAPLSSGSTIVETYTTGTAKIIEIVPEGEPIPAAPVVRRPPVQCSGFGLIAGTAQCVRVEVR